MRLPKVGDLVHDKECDDYAIITEITHDEEIGGQAWGYWTNKQEHAQKAFEQKNNGLRGYALVDERLRIMRPAKITIKDYLEVELDGREAS